MCQFKSGLILRERTYAPWGMDSHEDMIRELNLNDSGYEPDFVRVELIPSGKEWWKSSKDWMFKVDQDYLPDWWNAEWAEKEMKIAVQKNLPLINYDGSLYLEGTQITELPEGLSVGGFLDLRGTQITELPDGLEVGGNLYIRRTKINKETIPDHLKDKIRRF